MIVNGIRIIIKEDKGCYNIKNNTGASTFEWVFSCGGI